MNTPCPDMDNAAHEWININDKGDAYSGRVFYDDLTIQDIALYPLCFLRVFPMASLTGKTKLFETPCMQVASMAICHAVQCILVWSGA